MIFWQYSSGSTPLTGMEAGLLTTTTSSSMCITVIGSEVTGTSCLQHTNRNQLNMALFRLHLHISHVYRYTRIHTHIHTHAFSSYVYIRASILQQVSFPRPSRQCSLPQGSAVDRLGFKRTGNEVGQIITVMLRERHGATID